MLKRQKILLGLLLHAPRDPSRIEFMKWVFLLGKDSEAPGTKEVYSFFPYKFGPYSFAVTKDMDDLGRFGYVRNGTGYAIEPRMRSQAFGEYRSLAMGDRQSIQAVLREYGALREKQLVRRVYEMYPWYASRSQLPFAPKAMRPRAGLAIYTTGYEGESIDAFLAKLLDKGIERLIDVRNNPVSRKYGFSKGQLSRLCLELGIEYVHLPGLGVPPEKRAFLKTPGDYQELLDEYEKSMLPQAGDERREAARLVKERPSVLVCFESDVACCHRGRLAKALKAVTQFEVLHL